MMFDATADAHVVEPVLHGLQTSLDIAKAFPVGQLGKGQAEELIETEKTLDLVIPLVAANTFSELVKRQEGHDLGEDGRLGIHRSLLDIWCPKSPDYIKSRSNRLRHKWPVLFSLCG